MNKLNSSTYEQFGYFDQGVMMTETKASILEVQTAYTTTTTTTTSTTTIQYKQDRQSIV